MSAKKDVDDVLFFYGLFLLKNQRTGSFYLFL
jgi:hypothetical protein